MQKRIVSLVTPFVVGIVALALGWFAHAAAPLSAQGVVVQGQAVTSSNPAAPAGTLDRLTYQGRLTNSSGTTINGPVAATFRLYDLFGSPIYTAIRTITPTNGLFTINLGDGTDPNLYDVNLSAAAFIGVAVGGDAEMTPRQALNTVVGHGNWTAGVIGGSNSDTGVFGESTTGTGVEGRTSSITQPAIRAYSFVSPGTALEIVGGGIKVANASGFDRNTFAFVHESYVTNTVTNYTIITNSLTDGDQSAMLFVTPVNNPAGYGGSNDFNFIFGVFYDGSQWAIYREDGGTFPPNKTFNVMVIKR